MAKVKTSDEIAEEDRFKKQQDQEKHVAHLVLHEFGNVYRYEKTIAHFLFADRYRVNIYSFCDDPSGEMILKQPSRISHSFYVKVLGNRITHSIPPIREKATICQKPTY